jgi:L,D-transpeptidase catalytic domain
MHPLKGIAVAALAAALVAGCGDGDAYLKSLPAGAAATPAASSPSGDTRTTAKPTAMRAVVSHAITVYRKPNGAPMLTLKPVTLMGSHTVLLVRKLVEGGDWMLVDLAMRPNGSQGYVRGSDVTLQQVFDSITVDLSARTITVSLQGGKSATAHVAIGSSRYRTPTGRFYVTDAIQPTNPGGEFGTFVLGTSAYSPTLTEFMGGPGQVGIHGTNNPASIGQAVSHGCIRVPENIDRDVLPWVHLGTPVTILA